MANQRMVCYAFPYTSFTPNLDLSQSEKIDLLIQQIRNGNGRRFIYVDNPNNPTGDFAPLESIEKLSQHPPKILKNFKEITNSLQ